MAKKQEKTRDLRIDVLIGERGRTYRVTHNPSGVHAESDSVREALDAVNGGLEDAA